MNPIAEKIIAEIDPSVYEHVARSVVGDSSARIVDEPRWTEIDASHGDFRTLAILRVEGIASVGTRQIPWSSVQKLIDTTVDGGPGNAGSWVDPAREETVYERGLFNDDGLRFRAVKCFHITRPRPGIKMFWLEDLTEADRTPFSVQQLHRILRDLGEFNGFHANHEIDDLIETGTDLYLSRWTGAGHPQRIDRAAELTDRPEIQRVFRTTTVETVHELFGVLDRLNEQSQKLQHTLSFGDCNTGNLFRLGDQTVAIDWATVTMDPTGVDAGCLIGSAMAWSRDAEPILKAEKELFSSYLTGLRSGGWTGDADHVRQAFFGQFGTYLMVPLGWSRVLDSPPERAEWVRDWMEKRFQTPFEEIPDLSAPIVDSYPRYIDEVSRMLDSRAE